MGGGRGLTVTAPLSLPASDWVKEENFIQLRVRLPGMAFLPVFCGPLWERGLQGKEVAELKMFLSFLIASKSLSLKKLYGNVRKFQALENHKPIVTHNS